MEINRRHYFQSGPRPSTNSYFNTCVQINFIEKICNWQQFSWNLMSQKEQHGFQIWNVLYTLLANTTHEELHEQCKLPYSSALDQGYIPLPLPLHCCSCHPLNHHATPWHSTHHVAHSPSTHTGEMKLTPWLIYPILMDSTSSSVLGRDGLCWVCGYCHNDKNSSQLTNAWLPRGCYCKMYFLEIKITFSSMCLPKPMKHTAFCTGISCTSPWNILWCPNQEVVLCLCAVWWEIHNSQVP